MSQQITAFLSEDGQLHRTIEDADFSDYMNAVAFSVGAFSDELTASKRVLDMKEVLLDWEMWRIGGREGWLTQRAATAAPPLLAPAQAQLPLMAAPAPAPKPSAPAKAKAAPTPAQTAITVALDSAREVARARAIAETRPAAKAPTAYRKHVGVIGLFNIHHANIEKEFGNELKLSIFDADCMARLQGLRACHKVVVMTKFVSHKHIDALKAIGQEPLLVNGGMDKLKEALTNIYVNS